MNVPAPHEGTAVLAERLLTGDITVLGQVADSSNVVVVVEVDGVRAVHKPVAGEKPLWDFTHGNLAQRERATYLVSEALGWGLVPATVLRDGPWGPGSFQVWVEDTDGERFVDVVPSGAVLPGWIAVLSGEDQTGAPVDVVHRDVAGLRRLALLDAVVNNSDRKGGHVLSDGGDSPLGIDHGLTFHADPKLRTVLWGWAGRELLDDERAALSALQAHLEDATSALSTELVSLLSVDEMAATRARVAELLRAEAFPVPDGRWPAVPWPPF